MNTSNASAERIRVAKFYAESMQEILVRDEMLQAIKHGLPPNLPADCCLNRSSLFGPKFAFSNFDSFVS